MRKRKKIQKVLYALKVREQSEIRLSLTAYLCGLCRKRYKSMDFDEKTLLSVRQNIRILQLFDTLCAAIC